MKTKLALSLVAAALLTGCGTTMTTTSLMDISDLRDYQIDCSIREEQEAFLRSQMSTPGDKLKIGLSTSSLSASALSIRNGTYGENVASSKGLQDANIRVKLDQIKQYCAIYDEDKRRRAIVDARIGKPVAPVNQGCTNLRESFPSGDSQGARCNENGKRPATRWEALVDSK